LSTGHPVAAAALGLDGAAPGPVDVVIAHLLAGSGA
jgi:hypothetical protein